MTENRPASTTGTETAVLRGPCHNISVEIAGRGWVDATFTCTATEGADCRLTCPEGCPEWDAADHVHPLVDAGECMALPWLDAEEWDEQYAGPRTELRSGPVELEFTGDGYTWTYAALPAPEPLQRGPFPGGAWTGTTARGFCSYIGCTLPADTWVGETPLCDIHAQPKYLHGVSNNGGSDATS